MIEIKITVPNDEVGDDSAVQRRMRMLGYGVHFPAFDGSLTRAALYQPETDAPAVMTATETLWAEKAAQPAREDDLGQQARIDASHAKAEPVKKTRTKKAEPLTEPAKAAMTHAVSEGISGTVVNISAQPEARVDPEVEAQDEADEAAEVAAAAPANEVVTPETLRAEMGAYAQKFGMDAALADGTAIFTNALGPAPDGGWKLSVVAGIGGETLAKAVVAWRAAAAGGARYGG